MTGKKRPELEEIQTKMQQLLSDYLQKNPDNIYEIAMILDVRISTITRWSSGRNLPHPTLCPSIIRFLEEKRDAPNTETETRNPTHAHNEKGITFLFKDSSRFED